jgi:hypothetical protein
MQEKPINTSMEDIKPKKERDYSKLPIFERECDIHLDEFASRVDLSDLTIVKRIKTGDETYIIPLPMARGQMSIKVRRSAIDPNKYIVSDGGSLAIKWMELGIFSVEHELRIMTGQLHDFTDFKMDGDKVISVECNSEEIENVISNFISDMLTAEVDLEGYRFTKMMLLDWPKSFMTCCDGSPFSLDDFNKKDDPEGDKPSDEEDLKI